MQLLSRKREPLYHIDVNMQRGVPGLISSIRHSELVAFAKKCNPNAEVTSGNLETWILRYVIEEKGYSSAKMESLKIAETDIVQIT